MKKLLRLVIIFLLVAASPVHAGEPSNMDLCVCTYIALHFYGSTPEELRRFDEELRRKYNQTYEERVNDRCKIFTQTQDFKTTAANLDSATGGKVRECLDKRK